MILKKKIPNDFYKLFRTKNREAYMQFVTAIYEENNEVYASLGLTQEECALIIENTIEKSKIVWQEEDVWRKEKRRMHYFQAILLPAC